MNKSLPKRFPDAPFIARLKIWTPKRNIIEVEGPYDETSGELILLAACITQPNDTQLAAMKECLSVLKEGS